MVLKYTCIFNLFPLLTTLPLQQIKKTTINTEFLIPGVFLSNGVLHTWFKKLSNPYVALVRILSIFFHFYSKYAEYRLIYP